MYSLRHLVACNCSKIYFCFCFDLGVIKKFFFYYLRLSSIGDCPVPPIWYITMLEPLFFL